MEQEKYVLEMTGLSKSFGKNHVLRDVSLKVRPGTVRGLRGENGAGKSTMMKCLFGIYSMDSGEVKLDGVNVNFNSPKEALENGIAMVHQELNQCLDRSIIDNIYLGRYRTRAGIINENARYYKCLQLFSDLGRNYNPKTIRRTMSVSQRQMVEIAKAVSYNAKVIVLDEPTSSLSEREVKKLFEIINRLKKEKNISFVFISHKRDEIYEICDDITILRDGEVTLQDLVKNTDLNILVKARVGRSLDNRFPPMTNKPGDDILLVHNLSTKYKPYLKDISFNLRKGEILGIYGLVGAGRTELLESLFGIRTIATGEIFFNGKRIFFKDANEARKANFAFVSEERKVQGLFPMDDLTFNICIADLDKYKKFGILSNGRMRDAAKREISLRHTKCNDENDKISSLSGGNQQKVIIGRWLERTPDIFLLDEPTRGIDIMAKYQIYELRISLANQGKSVIMVSSERPEILGVTNRILVMSNYRMAGIVDTKSTNQTELRKLCAKYL